MFFGPTLLHLSQLAILPITFLGWKATLKCSSPAWISCSTFASHGLKTISIVEGFREVIIKSIHRIVIIPESHLKVPYSHLLPVSVQSSLEGFFSQSSVSPSTTSSSPTSVSGTIQFFEGLLKRGFQDK